MRTLRARSPSVEECAYTFGGLIVGWLLLASAIVDIEYYDGLSAVCNARYFLGQSASYIFDRGPLMAWVLMPAEWVKGWLALAPLDFRLHHAVMTILHGGYLAAVYRGLVRYFGREWSVLVALATAVTSFVFFSYAPFLSHDLAPGALLLWMLIWSEDFVSSFRSTGQESAHATRLRLWLLLVVAGTLAPLVKQTYGVFWVAVLGAHVLTARVRGARHPDSPARPLAWLAAAAGASALLTWMVYGLVLANWAPDVPLWLRPYRNLQYLAGVYDGTDVTFPLWIYVRNFWAYGRLTTLLLIPGIVLSLRGSAVQRRMAIAWTIAVLFVHAMPLREVRYLAFLAPVSAFMIVPAVQLFVEQRLAAFAIAALLVFDLAGAVIETSRIGSAFYRHSELRALVEPLSDQRRLDRPLFHNLSMLSFVAPGQSPLAADRYHRIFHVGIHHLGVLYGYSPQAVRMVPPSTPARVSASAPEGSVLLFSSGIVAHGPTWVPGSPVGHESLVQGLATLETMTLGRQANGAYRRADQDGRSPGPVQYLMPVAILAGERAIVLQPAGDGQFVLPGSVDETPPDRLTMRAFVVRRGSGAR